MSIGWSGIIEPEVVRENVKAEPAVSIDHPAFRMEDTKCVAIWSHIRELMAKMNEKAGA